jgi:hypothetical protein
MSWSPARSGPSPVKTNKAFDCAIGEPVAASVPRQRTYAFDGDTGERLRG